MRARSRMSRSPLMLCLALALPVLGGCATPPAPVTAREPLPPRVPLRGADCLDPATTRNFQYIDSSQLLVDAGRRKYRIRLSEFCTDLASADQVAFRGDMVSGRICGNIGERIMVGRMQCRIDRVELIDEATWREALGGQRGSATVGTDIE